MQVASISASCEQFSQAEKCCCQLSLEQACGLAVSTRSRSAIASKGFDRVASFVQTHANKSFPFIKIASGSVCDPVTIGKDSFHS